MFEFFSGIVSALHGDIDSDSEDYNIFHNVHQHTLLIDFYFIFIIERSQIILKY